MERIRLWHVTFMVFSFSFLVSPLCAQNLAIRITSPTPGGEISRSRVLVLGEVSGPLEAELGVTVNEVGAEVGSGQFGAVIPLQLGPNTITATVVDSMGNSATDAISVNVPALEEEPLILLANPSRGFNPLTVGFGALSLLSQAIVLYELDYEGDGVVDFSSPTFDNVSHTYPTVGLFFPTLTVTDDNGDRTSATAIVNVFTQATLVASLVGKWNAMKNALRGENIEAALTFITGNARERYRQIFQNLTVPLSEIDQVLTNITFVQFRE